MLAIPGISVKGKDQVVITIEREDIQDGPSRDYLGNAHALPAIGLLNFIMPIV